jgi:hypothetical protein
MLYYKMNTQTIFMCVVALLIGMLVANMLQNVCGCKKVEGFANDSVEGFRMGAADAGGHGWGRPVDISDFGKKASTLYPGIFSADLQPRSNFMCGGRHGSRAAWTKDEAEIIADNFCKVVQDNSSSPDLSMLQLPTKLKDILTGSASPDFIESDDLGLYNSIADERATSAGGGRCTIDSTIAGYMSDPEYLPKLMDSMSTACGITTTTSQEQENPPTTTTTEVLFDTAEGGEQAGSLGQDP